jgi:hypothetical protein
MGWSWAPTIGQVISATVLGSIRGFVYLDNYVILGDTEEEVIDNCEKLRSRLKAANVEVDDLTMTPTQYPEVLGMKFDLREGKMTVELHLDEVTSVDCTPRKLFTIAGKVFWACYALSIPLAQYDSLYQLVRRTAIDLTDWDAPFQLSEQERLETNLAAKKISEAGWSDPRAKKAEVIIVSDASEEVCAYAVFSLLGEFIRGEIFPPQSEGATIFQNEAYSITRAARVTKVPAVLITDNLALKYCLNRGHSHLSEVNGMMAQLYDDCPKHYYVSEWVASEANILDPCTRGWPMLSSTEDLVDQHLSALAKKPLADDIEGELREAMEVVKGGDRKAKRDFWNRWNLLFRNRDLPAFTDRKSSLSFFFLSNPFVSSTTFQRYIV